LIFWEREIQYLKCKYKNIKNFYDLCEDRTKLLGNVLNCDYSEIELYENEIKTYYDKFCNKNPYIDVLVIQYYECIFEYKYWFSQFNTTNISRFSERGYISLTKEKQDKLNSMECEKLNTCLDNINLDILIRQLGAIMKS